MGYQTIGLSSNGRISGFDPEGLGSNPSELAKILGRPELERGANVSVERPLAREQDTQKDIMPIAHRNLWAFLLTLDKFIAIIDKCKNLIILSNV